MAAQLSIMKKLDFPEQINELTMSKLEMTIGKPLRWKK